MSIAITPHPPYYAVIFSSQRKQTLNEDQYNQMVQKMTELAKQQEGFLGVEHVNGENGLELTISYWNTLKAIQQWKEHTAHQTVKQKGKDWYLQFKTRICKVEQDYESLLNEETIHENREVAMQ